MFKKILLVTALSLFAFSAVKIAPHKRGELSKGSAIHFNAHPIKSNTTHYFSSLFIETAYADSCKQVNESCMNDKCCPGLACAGQWPDVICSGL